MTEKCRLIAALDHEHKINHVTAGELNLLAHITRVLRHKGMSLIDVQAATTWAFKKTVK